MDGELSQGWFVTCASSLLPFLSVIIVDVIRRRFRPLPDQTPPRDTTHAGDWMGIQTPLRLGQIGPVDDARYAGWSRHALR